MKRTAYIGLPLAVMLFVVACEGPAERPEEEPAAEAATSEQMVHVTNRMPHVMIVSVVESEEVRELGSVEPDATEMFTVSGEAGEEVDLVARDEAETHAVDFTVEVGEEVPTWTLGGG